VLRAEPPAATDAIIAVDVTPPAGSGLPRLLGQSTTMFDLTKPLQIRYAASLALRDVGGVKIQRAGGSLAGAKVILVGGLAGVGTVATGTMAPVIASGAAQIAAAADGTGALPSTLAPARPLSAVVVVDAAANDYAVAAIDLTSGKPATIDAPAAVPMPTQLRGPTAVPIADAVLDAVPVGALAQAGITSSIRARSGANGQLSVSLAAGGHYDLRIHDPVHARGAAQLALDVTAQTLGATYALRPALFATGTLLQQGSPTPVGGAALQFLCALCSGLDRSRPIAEGTSQSDGTFLLVIPDPGTN
jgi:hypothetical protein